MRFLLAGAAGLCLLAFPAQAAPSQASPPAAAAPTPAKAGGQPATRAAPEEAPIPFSDAEQAGIRRVVHDYLLEHPEVIEEAVQALQAKRDDEEAARARAAITEHHDELYNDARDFSVGPKDAPVQIVEFFDYNCPYCRASASWVKQTLQSHADKVRFVFKEAPIFEDSKPSSGPAARAAVAAIGQGHYLDVYFAFMNQSGTIPASQVRHIAEGVGVNWRTAQPVMDSEATTKQLQSGLDLLYAVGGATGTPTFIVNGEIVQGADVDRLDSLLKTALGG
jgi:protein-disulfide isomerase